MEPQGANILGIFREIGRTTRGLTYKGYFGKVVEPQRANIQSIFKESN